MFPFLLPVPFLYFFFHLSSAFILLFSSEPLSSLHPDFLLSFPFPEGFSSFLHPLILLPAYLLSFLSPSSCPLPSSCSSPLILCRLSIRLSFHLSVSVVRGGRDKNATEERAVTCLRKFFSFASGADASAPCLILEVALTVQML